MLTKDTVFVEITGVFGAGYLPKLIEDLKRRLIDGLRLRTAGGARPLNVLRCIDNSLAEARDLRYRDEINTLILKAQRKAHSLTDEERDELVRGLHWVDGLVLEFVKGVRKGVDLVLRRGGILQAY